MSFLPEQDRHDRETETAVVVVVAAMIVINVRSAAVIRVADIETVTIPARKSLYRAPISISELR